MMASGFSTATLQFRSQWNVTFKMTHGHGQQRGGTDCGREGWVGWGGAKGKKMGQL